MKSPLKILIAEHDPIDLELLHHELTTGGVIYVFEVVQNEIDYVNALINFIPDIILADYTFPTFDGPTAFMIKERIAPDTPFLFVSGTIGEGKTIELIKSGVTDYVLKDKLFTLKPKLIRALREGEAKRQKKYFEQELILNERSLSRAQEVAHIGSWDLNFSSKVVRLSDEACRILGFQRGENIQSSVSWLTHIHPEDTDVVFNKIKDSGELLPGFTIHYRIVNSNGLIRHIYSDGRLDIDIQGKINGLFGIVHDVTENILLENKLIQARHMKQSEITAAVLTAQENERAAIGKELHENLNHILGVSNLYIELAKTDDVNRLMFMDKSIAYIVEVIREIRKISKSIAKPGKQISLYDLIQNLLDDLIVTNPVRIQFYKGNVDEVTLNENLQLDIFRIVQEQVNNILKHSQATSASITLKKKNHEVVLVVADNGKGTDILKEAGGVGIKNIRSRADLHSGIVTIVSTPGKGYVLKVTFSLKSYMRNPELMNSEHALSPS